MRFKTGTRLAAVAIATVALSLTAAPAFATTASSQDWAGYQAISQRSFQSVKASWIVPTIDCSATNVPGIPVYYDWVGLSSGNSSRSERIGISEICSQTTPISYTYLAFGGQAPSLSNVPQGPTITNVAGGDTVTASISYSSATHRYRFSIADVTRGETFTSARQCPPGVTCARSRADIGAGVAPEGEGPPSITLENYGHLPFSNITIGDSLGHKGAFGPTPYWTSVRVNEFDVGTLAASASLLINLGTSFTDTWHAY